ncbi:uncharacterized Rho GTPase-activating protein At5g61530 isoform X1 [Rhododendron vialii]|uniref:uncharacterized Rho GTPase-activating protein At5g61530 isoform X1 n=2 Tax=Rhododendron vialii TaxID=182163 RepID=UPI00265EFB70|nr:uncharacterized Rho GTPase-activating protein At5g61530 isoform X1 [Rhododendron vialii]
MPSAISPEWQEKASGFFSSSGVKLKEAGQSAGTFVGEVAKDAKGNVADVAGKVGSIVKSRWAILQQPSTKHAMQERLISAAATTGMIFRKSYSGTKDKVVVGKSKVEEVAKKTAQKSKVLLTDIERWQKGVASTDVFGVPIEVTVQRQQSSRPIPHILVTCADYLILSGLNSPELFKSDGDKKVIQQLVSSYNQDSNASLPEGINAVDVAALAKCYLASLPEPLATFELSKEIRGARSSIRVMRNILKKLPTVNYMTLELITALLLRVSQKSLLNKMDTRSLAMEMAPIIMWQKGQRPEHFRQFWNQPSEILSKKKMDPSPNFNACDMLDEDSESVDASSPIPLDDGLPIDFTAIEAVQCLIEHHNAIFTDANETVWR